MSGPKSARYILNPALRQAELQRLRLEMEKAAASNRLKIILSDMLNEQSTLSALEQRLKALNHDVPSSDAQSRLDTLSAQCGNALSAQNIAEMKSAIAAYSAQHNAIYSFKQSLAAQVEQAERQFEEKTAQSVDSAFALRYRKKKEHSPVQPQKTSEKATSDYDWHELDAIAALSLLPKEDVDKLALLKKELAAITDSSYRRSYIALMIKPFEGQCRQRRSDYEQHADIWNDLIDRRNALYAGLELDTPDVPLFSLDALHALEQEVSVLEERMLAIREQEQVSRILSETMRELGYDLLGERETVKRSGRRFHNVLYAYDEGTAINVTYASDGKISMELGGLDEEDRLPSAREVERLTLGMRHFCTHFGEIERILAKKGVVVGERLSMLPPSADHAQIINVVDYTMVQSDETGNTGTGGTKVIKYMRGE